jgi:hypothetical protein
MLTCNLVGIVFSRSLHYQFYSWYAYQVPFFVYKSRAPLLLKSVCFPSIKLVALTISLYRKQACLPSWCRTCVEHLPSYVAVLDGTAVLQPVFPLHHAPCANQLESTRVTIGNACVVAWAVAKSTFPSVLEQTIVFTPKILYFDILFRSEVRRGLDANLTQA